LGLETSRSRLESQGKQLGEVENHLVPPAESLVQSVENILQAKLGLVTREASSLGNRGEVELNKGSIAWVVMKEVFENPMEG
jgi:hypothetical protein